MRTATVVGLALMSLVSPAFAAGFFPYPHQRATMPNGLAVIMIPMPSPGLVTYYSIVRTGSRDEVEQGKSGFAHFFEHMMFRGTKTFPGPIYDSIVTGIGADANAFTTDDLTAYHLSFAKEDLETVIKIESDRFQNLDYEKPAFQTEAGAIYGEFRKSQTSPFFLLEEKVKDIAYDVHTYKHTTMGFEADVKAMSEAYEYSLSFFQRFYRPENVVLLIVGDVDPASTMDLVRKYYGPWKRGYVEPKVPVEPPQTKERTGEVSYPGRTLPILEVAYKGDRFDPASREYAAAILMGELAFGSNSDLNKKLVINEQKAEFVTADVPMNRDPSLIEIYAMIKKVEDVGYVRDEIYRTIERFQNKPADSAKLDQLKRRNKYAFLMSLDAPDRVASHLARIVALTGGIEAVDRLYEEFDRVTLEDIQQAAKKYFQPQRRTVVVLKGAQG